jgi:predicted nucleic acid-binding protein
VGRVFLDANVLFSAAYRGDSGLLKLWSTRELQLCSSHYALEEARSNLTEPDQKQRLAKLSEKLALYDAAAQQLPRDIHLPLKDTPIFLGALEAKATHLLTGDIRHFGPYLGKKIAGILIMLPGEYLRRRKV